MIKILSGIIMWRANTMFEFSLVQHLNPGAGQKTLAAVQLFLNRANANESCLIKIF